ncbi:MAG: hypothetical protein HY260_12330 [Chloroflexi bacterium]|nr:hypothetical protein [Chloroflexota bacterium]
MSDSTFWIIPLVIVGDVILMAAFVALAFGIAYYQRQARERAWGELAGRTGLTLEPGNFLTGPRVTGNFRGHTITLDTFSRGSGKSRTTYTRIVVFVNNQANVYLALYQESVFSKIGKFFGMEDVQIGDEDVDRRFIIKSRPETFAARLFTSINLRQKLLQARAVNIEVDGRELHFEQQGVETNADYMQFLFDLLSDVAEMVERAG